MLKKKEQRKLKQKIFLRNMELVATQKVMKDYGLCAIKCYKIKGRT